MTRHVGTALIQCGELKTVDEVVFAQPGDLSFLGARTLEGFRATALMDGATRIVEGLAFDPNEPIPPYAERPEEIRARFRV